MEEVQKKNPDYEFLSDGLHVSNIVFSFFEFFIYLYYSQINVKHIRWPVSRYALSCPFMLDKTVQDTWETASCPTSEKTTPMPMRHPYMGNRAECAIWFMDGFNRISKPG